MHKESATTCQCELSGFCKVRNREVAVPLQMICKKNPAKVNRLLDEKLQEQIREQVAKKIPQRWARPRHAPSREPVGDALSKRIADLLKIKSGKGCGCKKLADDMNAWGIAGCERNRTAIVDSLVANREMLSASLSDRSWLAGVAADLAPDAVLKTGADWLLTQAINDVKAMPVPVIRRPAATPRQSRARKNPFAMGKAPARFITIEQYAKDVRTLLSKVPHDVDAVAGVARSGLYPASMVAMWLHKPMFIVSQAAGNIVEAGNGWRLGRGHNHIPPGTGKVLVVDDTVMTGGSQQIIRRVIGNKFREVIYATVYCNPLATLGKPDIRAVDLEWPHLLEWNIFNSVISHSTAVDFDGILCHDCPPGSDDDGEKYLHFIQNATPLYLPRKEPLPLIVTARIEKYREPTEDWLRRHGVKWHKLVMHPASSTRERERDDVAAYKARHFDAWAKTHRPAPGPIMFIESEDVQARRIALLTGRMTVCPATAAVYGPQNSAVKQMLK